MRAMKTGLFKRQLGEETQGETQEGNGKETSKDRDNGDCTQWTSEGQCSRGDSFSFKRDVNKKGKR